METLWNLDPPPGFHGLHPDCPVKVYQRHLPHWRQAGATYFVTFRLADSLPAAKLHEFKRIRMEWEVIRERPNRELERCWKAGFRKIDAWLDQGFGSCRLANRNASGLVAETLTHFEGQRFDMGCFVVMPNHVHLVVRPFDKDEEALERIIHSWKRQTAREINKLDGRRGEFWQSESYDRIIRDEEHLWRVVQYIGANPVQAKLRPDEYVLWIHPCVGRLGLEVLELMARPVSIG